MRNRERALCVSMLMASLGASQAMAGLFDDWSRSTTVTFTKCPAGEALTNFPALIVLGSHIPSFRYSQFMSGANADLRFADATGSQEIPYEVEEWNPNGSSYVWVRVPALTNGLTIKAHWGKFGLSAPSYTTNGAVWSEGFAGVWHMRTIDAQDSTSNRNHGVSVWHPTASAGVVDGAVSFPGVNEYVKATNAAGLNMTNALTLSMWIKPDSTANKGVIIKGPMSSSQGVYNLNLYQDKLYFRLNGATTEGNGQVSSPAAIRTNEWQHVCATYDRAYQRLYLNGTFSAQQTYAAAIMTDNNSLVIGGYYTSGKTLFDGVMDEVRVDSVARSPYWVWATYMTMASNDVFTGYGDAVPSRTFSTWRNCMDITFTNVPPGETLNHFPALVMLGSQIQGFNYAHFLSGSHDDLRFTDAWGEELAYEVEEWNAGGDSYVWVRVPELVEGSKITAHWGQEGVAAPAYTTNGATWSEGFAGVWHMRQTSALDSTANANHGVALGNPTLSAGVADGAVNLDGSGDYIGVADAASLNFTNRLSVSMWIRPVSTANKGLIMKGALSASQGVYNLSLNQDKVYARLNGSITEGAGQVTSSPAILANEWQLVYLTYDRSYERLFLNGQVNAQQPYTAALSTNNGTLNIGAYYSPDFLFNGRIDEVRIENEARSSNWVWCCYMTVASNSVLQAYGTVDRKPFGTV
ncbi:MAG: DUF2341 domain-containing protein, partial [Kiritimatiellae bacterium]|nr:DUF2341 domain-containing protein [Kiritimatiellia bacterium]